MIDIVIPKLPEHKLITDFSRQTYKDFKVYTIVDVSRKGQSWAKNEGFKMGNSDLVLFSDCDIEWQVDALEIMLNKLEATPKASYCYPAFLWDNEIFGYRYFDAKALKQSNYITGNSLIRRKDFLPFDESLHRLEDWDLWLRLLLQNKIGVWAEEILFYTKGKRISDISTHYKAERLIRRKYDSNFNHNI